MSPKITTEQRDERRAQILQAAMTCFAEKGYHLTTMDDIVTASGMSKGSIYWYYKSKKEILMAMLEVVFADVNVMMGEAPADSTGSATDKLRRLLELSVTALGDLLGVMIDFWSASRHDADFSRALREMYEPFLQTMTVLIEEGIQHDEFRPVNAANLAAFLIGAGDGLMIQSVVGLPVDWRGVMETFLDDVLLEGLRPR